MAYKTVELVAYTPDATLTTLENAQARKAHYESESARMHALMLVKECESRNIKVQGNQHGQ